MPANFTQDDFDNLELVRQIVLRRLKDDTSWNQFDYQWDTRHTGQYVTYENSQLNTRFIVLVIEVMWQLIMQGVITPGMNAANLSLPWFRVTSYGKMVLETERFIPHDPSGYLDGVREVAGTTVGQAALTYLEEALRCFTSGCHLASVLLLGVAAEAVFLRLCGVISGALQDDTERTQFDRLQWVKPKHRWVVEKYAALPSEVRRGHLPQSLDVTLTSLYDLIRRQRNELGHPQEDPPAIDRELAFTYFKLFPTFIKDVEVFAAYSQTHGL